jgi:sulfite reductase alpha subunit-like flavoprotein
MAKDVDATLVAIAQQHGNLSEEAAAEYTRTLAAEERYVRDVY